MNMDNNNYENNLGSEQLGGVQTPDFNQAPNPQTEETFNPFQDLNNAPLNVPTENLDNGFNNTPSVDNLNVQAAPVQEEPSFYQPEMPADSLNVEPQVTLNNTSENIQSNASTINNDFNQNQSIAPDVINQAPTFETMQSAPSIDTFNQTSSEVQAPVQTPTVAAPEYTQTVQESEPIAQTPVTDGPTMPIPDQMPSTDYQAGVSTPVDYATPMSDFDQIGTTPELDPKAKGKKKQNKLLLVILLLIIIGGIGYGSYYLINVMGILDSKNVTVKEVTAEKGESLSVNIDDYATFKNTSSSNCVLDTTKVDISKTGTYDFTVTCGDKSYTGKVTVKDTKGPEIEVNTKIVSAGTTLTADMLVANANETAAYEYASETEANAFTTAGLKAVKVNATDENGNKQTYHIPVIVTTSEFSMGIVSKKDVSGDNTSANIIEKNVILYNNSGGMFNDTSYTAYVIKFNDNNLYKEAIKSYDNSGSLTYESYTGIPLFYSSANTLILVKDINSELIKEDYNTTYTNLTASGYDTKSVNQYTNKDLIDFNK